jgi:hypothetical protein
MGSGAITRPWEEWCRLIHLNWSSLREM